jgi:hypothetical protein
MPRLLALMLALGVVATAGTASATVYVPGHIRDGFYIRPHFVSAPEGTYKPELPAANESKADDPLLSDPLKMDESLPAEKLPADGAS